MNKSELAEEICEELGLDYYEVYNEDGANVRSSFLEAVYGEVVMRGSSSDIEQKVNRLIDQYDIQDADKLPQHELAHIVNDIVYDLLDLRKVVAGGDPDE